jgi:hypothetical protein
MPSLVVSIYGERRESGIDRKRVRHEGSAGELFVKFLFRAPCSGRVRECFRSQRRDRQSATYAEGGENSRPACSAAFCVAGRFKSERGMRGVRPDAASSMTMTSPGVST